MKKIILSFILLAHLPAHTSVIGELGRLPVANSESPTFRVFGQVEDFCTGTMISPRLVLTAAHCVYNQQEKSWMPLRTFTPARDRSLAPFGSIAVERVHVPASYLVGDDRQDLAVLVLREAVGFKTGWLRIGWDLQGFLRHNSALGGFAASGTISGYPGDQEQGSMWFVACDFYVPNLTPLLPQYRCDTFGGMSGSALVIAGPRGESTVVGVHTKGHGKFNSGIMLTHENKVFLQQILIQYPL